MPFRIFLTLIFIATSAFAAPPEQPTAADMGVEDGQEADSEPGTPPLPLRPENSAHETTDNPLPVAAPSAPAYAPPTRMSVTFPQENAAPGEVAPAPVAPVAPAAPAVASVPVEPAAVEGGAAPQPPKPGPRETLTLPDPATTPQNTNPAGNTVTAPGAVQVEAVQAPTLDSFGIVSDKDGGLDATAWKDSSSANASTLLSWIRGGIAHPALKELTIRLLISRNATPQETPDHWFERRIQALLAIGAEDKADAMIAAVPESMVTEALLRLRAELLLLRGDVATACKLQSGQTMANADAAFWQKLDIVCKASAGKRDEAMLALDIRREANVKDDEFLQDAVHKILDRTFNVKSYPATFTLFDVGLAKLAGELDKLKDRMDSLPPIALKYIAMDATLDPKTRSKAEGKAMMYGILPPKDNSKAPDQPFSTPLASDVTTLVTAFGSGNPPSEADNAVIARLALGPTAAVQDTRRVARLLSLMEPFGYKIPGEQWEKLVTRRTRYDGDIPATTVFDRLNDAAQHQRKGEVILLCGLMLGSADVEKTHELVLQPVVRALIAAGFTREAHAIAYDAVQSYRAH